MDYKLEERIKNVMSAVFDIPSNAINEESSPDNIDSWDSLKHMNLIISLEEEFNLNFNDNEIEDILSFKLTKLIIQEKID